MYKRLISSIGSLNDKDLNTSLNFYTFLVHHFSESCKNCICSNVTGQHTMQY